MTRKASLHTIRKLVAVTVGGLLLALLAGPQTALACQEDVTNATRYLRTLQGQAGRAKGDDRARVRNLLKDAAQTLAAARKDCNSAGNLFDKGVATAKVAAARASMLAADALIPGN